LWGNWEQIADRIDAGAEPRHLARVSLSSRRQGSGVTLREPVPDWNGYRWLVLAAYTESEQPLPLEIRLETKSNKGMDSIVNFELPDNAYHVRGSLEQLPCARLRKLNEVRNLLWFSCRLNRGTQFCLELFLSQYSSLLK
jgi:hypothetical protein